LSNAANHPGIDGQVAFFVLVYGLLSSSDQVISGPLDLVSSTLFSTEHGHLLNNNNK
jgi:hypothetical protein